MQVPVENHPEWGANPPKKSRVAGQGCGQGTEEGRRERGRGRRCLGERRCKRLWAALPWKDLDFVTWTERGPQQDLNGIKGDLNSHRPQMQPEGTREGAPRRKLGRGRIRKRSGRTAPS